MRRNRDAAFFAGFLALFQTSFPGKNCLPAKEAGIPSKAGPRENRKGHYPALNSLYLTIDNVLM